MLNNKKYTIPEKDIELINNALSGKGHAIKKKQDEKSSGISQSYDGIHEKARFYKITTYAGKTLRIDKSIYLKTGQKMIKKGTKWEDIPATLKQKIHFKNSDFKT